MSDGPTSTRRAHARDNHHPDGTEDGSGPRGLPIGSRVGPYRICYEIGRGGMARVYLAHAAHRAGAHRYIALKCIAEPLGASDEYREMFRDEARIATLLTHPHVCPVIDYGVSDGVPYLVMPYLAGETLEKLRRELAAPIGELPGELTETRRAALLARIVADACEGLHAAHELRDTNGAALHVVHRDVSPPNLMVTFDGCVKVLDFGVASAVDQAHETRTGLVKGKFSYIQPEALAGSLPDRRADVWGLGIVLWELLTGQRLFRRANDAATLQAVIGAEIPPPSGMRAGVPTLYDAVVLRALDRDPSTRYPTARALGRDLLACLGQQGAAIGTADLAELMGLLFPGVAAARRELVNVMSRVEESTTISLREDDVEFFEDSVPIGAAPEASHPLGRHGRPGSVRRGAVGDFTLRNPWPIVGMAFAFVFVGMLVGAALSRAAGRESGAIVCETPVAP